MEYLTPDGQQLTLDVTACGGGGAFLPNFEESLFLALNYTLGTNFVPNVLKKLFCHKNQSYSKSPKMDKSQVKNFPHSGGGGAFLPKF